MLEILEFIHSSFWRFAGSIFILIFLSWWSVALVAAFKPIVFSLQHIYNGISPDQELDIDDESYN